MGCFPSEIREFFISDLFCFDLLLKSANPAIQNKVEENSRNNPEYDMAKWQKWPFFIFDQKSILKNSPLA